MQRKLRRRNSNLEGQQVISLNANNFKLSGQTQAKREQSSDLIRRIRQTRSAKGSIKILLNSSKIEKSESKSKFSKKFNEIYLWRSQHKKSASEASNSIRNDEQKTSDILERKIDKKVQRNFIINTRKTRDELDLLSKGLEKDKSKTQLGKKVKWRPISAQTSTLESVDQSNFLLIKSCQKKDQDNYANITAFWKTNNKFVSLIPIERCENIVFDHPNILPIFGEVTLFNRKFIVSDQYKNSSLKDLLEQFGPFDESLSRKYLLQIVQGIRKMHFHQISHNRLNTSSILYRKDGEMCIDVTKACSRSLLESQKKKGIHIYSPQLLQLERGALKSFKNDIWAIGCIVYQMMTSESISLSKLHPYNDNFEGNLTFEEESMRENVRTFLPKFQQVSRVQSEIKYANKISSKKLSKKALDLIQSCLIVRAQKRITLEELLQHDFFQQV